MSKTKNGVPWKELRQKEVIKESRKSWIAFSMKNRNDRCLKASYVFYRNIVWKARGDMFHIKNGFLLWNPLSDYLGFDIYGSFEVFKHFLFIEALCYLADSIISAVHIHVDFPCEC